MIPKFLRGKERPPLLLELLANPCVMFGLGVLLAIYLLGCNDLNALAALTQISLYLCVTGFCATLSTRIPGCTLYQKPVSSERELIGKD